MELTAISEALEYLARCSRAIIVVHTDSQFACDGYTLANARLIRQEEELLQQKRPPVERLYRAINLHRDVVFDKVKSHIGNKDHNDVNKEAKRVMRELRDGREESSLRKDLRLPWGTISAPQLYSAALC